MTTKIEMLKCDLTVDTVTFTHMVRDGEEFKPSETTAPLVINCGEVAESLINGEGFASMKAYGIRAFLNDRASDYRKYGIEAYMDQMVEVFNTTLAHGLFKAKRAGKAKGLDTMLIAAIAELKGLEYAVAESSLRKLTPEQLEVVTANPTVKAALAELAAKRAKAETVDLSDMF